MIKLESLNKYVEVYLNDVDNYIYSVISPNFVYDIVKGVSFGGKRIRPIIMILLSNILGGNSRDQMILAASGVELMHLASLMHDDVIDSGSKRHNVTSAHLLFSNQKAILGGDFLFSESFKAMVLTSNIEVLKSISNVSSTLVSGELQQLKEKETSIVSESIYYDIIYKKTASLFVASAEISSLIQRQSIISEVAQFGKNIGMAFQIIDDLIDYKSINTAKEQGVDFFEQKQTLPIIFSLSENSLLSEREKVNLKYLFSRYVKNAQDFVEASNLIEKAVGFAYTKKIADNFCIEAKANLDSFCYNESVEKQLMFEIIDFFNSRTF